MALHHVTIYHNNSTRLRPYQAGHRLTAKVSHWFDLDDHIGADELPEWAFRLFNADLAELEHNRRERGGETAFLAACIYRMLHYRPLALGDVIQTVTGHRNRWAAYESGGWATIQPPTNIVGHGLTAEKVHWHLVAQQHQR